MSKFSARHIVFNVATLVPDGSISTRLSPAMQREKIEDFYDSMILIIRDLKGNVDTMADGKVFYYWDVEIEGLEETVAKALQVAGDFVREWQEVDESGLTKVSFIIEVGQAYCGVFGFGTGPDLIVIEGGEVSALRLLSRNPAIYREFPIVVGAAAHAVILAASFQHFFEASVQSEELRDANRSLFSVKLN